jgi:hypothetical protein
MRHRGRAHRWGFTCVAPAAPFDGRTVLVPATEPAGNIYPLINEMRTPTCGRTRPSVRRSQSSELTFQRVDLCKVAPGVVVTASLAALESEPLARVSGAGQTDWIALSPGPAAAIDLDVDRPQAIPRHAGRSQGRGDAVLRRRPRAARQDQAQPARTPRPSRSSAASTATTR